MSHATRIAQVAKFIRARLREGDCESALQALTSFNYMRGAREEQRGLTKAWRANADWKLTTRVNLSLTDAVVSCFRKSRRK